MELLNFIFRLGVVFAIFGFIWGIINLGLMLLRGAQKKTQFEEYLIKAVKYIFLVDVTFLFCLDLDQQSISSYNLIMAGMVLLMYFTGKLQNQQNQTALFKMMGNGMPNMPISNFNLKAEIGVIVLSIAIFSGFIFYPNLAKNPISIWFHESILNIEDTPIFGFVFKIIGFFFLLSMLTKMLNAFMYLISGRPIIQATSSFQQRKEKKDENGFDDFEELE